MMSFTTTIVGLKVGHESVSHKNMLQLVNFVAIFLYLFVTPRQHNTTRTHKTKKYMTIETRLILLYSQIQTRCECIHLRYPTCWMIWWEVFSPHPVVRAISALASPLVPICTILPLATSQRRDAHLILSNYRVLMGSNHPDQSLSIFWVAAYAHNTDLNNK